MYLNIQKLINKILRLFISFSYTIYNIFGKSSNIFFDARTSSKYEINGIKTKYKSGRVTFNHIGSIGMFTIESIRVKKGITTTIISDIISRLIVIKSGNTMYSVS